MSEAEVPYIEELVIARLVGPLSYSRGKAYVDAGRVQNLRWSANDQYLRGDVSGSQSGPYHVSAALIGAMTSHCTVRTARCTCPISINCKHVAALLLASNAQYRAAVDAARGTAAARAADAPTGWRGAIAALDIAEADALHLSDAAHGASRGASGRGEAKGHRPLALEFDLRHRAAQRTNGGRYDHWGTKARDEKAKDAASVDRLVIRPVTTGARGAWIKGELTWQNIGYQGASGGFDPAQARWFRQLAILRGTMLGAYVEPGTEMITLDTFEATLLWALLSDAAGLGIALVGPGGSPIHRGEAASIGYDVSTTPDGGIRLAPTVVIDGIARDPNHVRLIGGHGVYAYDFDTHAYARAHTGVALTLAPLDRPLSRAHTALIEHPAEVMIAAAEVPEFLGDHYASLARSVTILSTDATFTPPPVAPPTLVLTARFEPAHALFLDWQWQLADQRRVALAAPDAVFSDPLTERMPSLRVAELLADDPAGASSLTEKGTLRASTSLQGVDAAEFTARLLPALDALDHVRVDIIGDKPDYREIVEAPVLTVTTVETESTDWFDLGVVITVEGKKVPFGPLFKALSRGAKKLLLVDQSYLSLQQPVFAPLRELIDEAGTLGEWETGVRISRYQTELWSEFEDLADQSDAAVQWRATVDGLRDLTTVDPVPVPDGFAGELRPYQVNGFRWLAFLYDHHLGGILADDMGLGKTPQTLALIAYAAARTNPREAPHPPFLVVAPTSVLSNWVREAARFTPGLRVAELTETRDKQGISLADAIGDADIVLTTYAILRLDAEHFAAAEWSGLVLDEAQFAKNATAKVHIAAAGIRAPFRLAVTGTPIENNLGELWAHFHLVAPGLFPSRKNFDVTYRRPIEVGHNAERLARLRRRVRPFLMRRTKAAVTPELPPKQEQVLEIPLDPRHRRIYDTHLQRERQKILGLVDDLDRNRFIVFRSLTLLRMLSLDASLVDPARYAGVRSAKLDALLEQVTDVVREGHQALVFSQFTSFLQRAKDRLDAAGIRSSYLDGSTRRRGAVIDEFRQGQTTVFLISLKAGGFGLNLTEADYVFLLDPWWNPASEEQAVDRAHRIGQTQPVMVYRMVATGTIEEKVMALKAKKAELVSAVLDDDAFFSEALTADDIRGLLEG